jgi:transcriptional regulator with XRE-family HTH domain
MKLAERIRTIRESYALTQKEVAWRCEMSPSAYGQIERNATQASFQTLSKIAKAIGVSILFLIDVDSTFYIEKTSYSLLSNS